MFSTPVTFIEELPEIVAERGTISEWPLPVIDKGTLTFDSLWLVPDVLVAPFVTLLQKDPSTNSYAVEYNGDIRVL